MKLRILKGPEADRAVAVDPDGFMLGRGKDNSLVLLDEGVSRHHCRISRSGEDWFAEDLGSTNGVRVNGHRISGPTRLADGDLIAICEQELRVELASPEASPMAASVPPVAAVSPDAAALPPLASEDASASVSVCSRLPLGRLALLAAMCLLIGLLAFLLLSAPKDHAPDEDPAVARSVEEGVVLPPVLSDAELDELIEREEALAKDEQDGAPGPAIPSPVPAVAGPPVAAGPEEAGASELVLVRSLPEGATVLVDDEEKGTTPLLISGLPHGRHRITLRKDGYQDHQRLIHVPDVISTAPYELRQRPNTLLVTSDPPGVSIWRGSQWLGTAPTLLQDLPAGEMSLTLAMPGCPPQREQVTISNVRGEQLSVAMKPELGHFEIETLPPGCRLLVDGLPMGMTAGENGGDGSTGTLRVPNLLAGERALRIEHPCGAFLAWKATIVPGETLRQSRRLWVPDIHLTLIDGTIKTGMLVERNDQGDVVVAESPLPRDMVRYLKPQIRAERPLGEAEAREFFQQTTSAAEAAAEPDLANLPGGAAEGQPDADQDEPPLPRDRVVEITADELREQFDAHSRTRLIQRYRGVTMQITGRPSSVRRDGLNGLVLFDRRIRCEIDRDVYEAHRTHLSDVMDAPRATLVIRGRVQGFMGEQLILRECVPVLP